jgi:hypothetical protein
MFENHTHFLEVPLDASQVKEFKPDQALRVVAYSNGAVSSQEVVRLDSDGKGAARLGFEKNPGAITVAVGPESSSAAELQQLQTVTFDVSAAAWNERSSVEASPVIISNYWWWWWRDWCRSYKITGRVVCADGVTPMAGAKVCAFDVNWWWWWISEDQVGCATTAADGSFEIDFTRCCGWWPWRWWETRNWILEPLLVDTIHAALAGTDIRLPRATPKPSLNAFSQIFKSGSSNPRASMDALSAVSTSKTIDTSMLEPLRKELMAVLPPQFPYRIWPWYPWWPWLDCGANIIFQVTQDCVGTTNLVVDETVFDARWDISNSLNVTLTANTDACCLVVGNGGPAEDCITPEEICNVNVGDIGGNYGSSVTDAAHIGIAGPGTSDQPFAETVDFYGSSLTNSTIDYYEIQYSTTGAAGSYVPVPWQAIGTIQRNALSNVTSLWVPVSFSYQTMSDTSAVSHFVLESTHHFKANNPWVAGFDLTESLLAALQTLNIFESGPCYVQLAGFTDPGNTGTLTPMDFGKEKNIIPTCLRRDREPAPSAYWVAYLDNRAPLPTDPTTQPCGGLHICTDQPLSDLYNMYILHADMTTTPFSSCGSICITPTDKLVVEYTAYDPEGFLDHYTLQSLYGTDGYVDLLSLGSTPIPASGGSEPAAAQVGPTYAMALSQHAVSPVWDGGSMQLTVLASDAFPQLPCAYQIQLDVYKRTIVGCDTYYWNESYQSFSVQACPTGTESLG